MAKRSKIAIAWSFLTQPLLKLSFLILFLLWFVAGQASSSALFYCQIGQSSKKLPEDKFRFQIKGNKIHFLPLEKSFILMKTACSSSPGQGLLVLLLWEKLNFIPEIHFLAGRGFSAIQTQVLLSRPIAPDSEKLHIPKNQYSLQNTFFGVLFCASLNV